MEKPFDYLKPHRPAPHSWEIAGYVLTGFGLIRYGLSGYTIGDSLLAMPVEKIITVSAGVGLLALAGWYLIIYSVWGRREMDKLVILAEAERQRAYADTIQRQNEYEQGVLHEEQTVYAKPQEWSLVYNDQTLTAGLIRKFFAGLRDGARMPAYYSQSLKETGFTRDWTKALYEWAESIGAARRDGAGTQAAYTLLDKDLVFQTCEIITMEV